MPGSDPLANPISVSNTALSGKNDVYIIRPTNFIYRLFDMWHPEMFRIGSGVLAAYREQFQRWSMESHAIRQLLQRLGKRAVVQIGCSGAENAKAVWQQEVKKTYNKVKAVLDEYERAEALQDERMMRRYPE